MPTGHRIKFWLPVVAWMIFIFIGSTDVGSVPHTSRFIVPFLRWLNPAISEETIRAVQTMIRKTGHVSEYAILALLVLRARRRPAEIGSPLWTWRDARFALCFAAAYAATDEFHQSFVPSREGSVWDALLDTLGAAAGLLILWFLGRWRKKW